MASLETHNGNLLVQPSAQLLPKPRRSGRQRLVLTPAGAFFWGQEVLHLALLALIADSRVWYWVDMTMVLYDALTLQGIRRLSSRIFKWLYSRLLSRLIYIRQVCPLLCRIRLSINIYLIKEPLFPHVKNVCPTPFFIRIHTFNTSIHTHWSNSAQS